MICAIFPDFRRLASRSYHNFTTDVTINPPSSHRRDPRVSIIIIMRQCRRRGCRNAPPLPRPMGPSDHPFSEVDGPRMGMVADHSTLRPPKKSKKTPRSPPNNNKHLNPVFLRFKNTAPILWPYIRTKGHPISETETPSRPWHGHDNPLEALFQHFTREIRILKGEPAEDPAPTQAAPVQQEEAPAEQTAPSSEQSADAPATEQGKQ